MKASRLVVKFDRLPPEMRLGDGAMRQLFKRRKNVPPSEQRCDAAVIVGLSPRHWAKDATDLMVGSAYRCPNYRVKDSYFCPWHIEGPAIADRPRNS